MLLLYRPNIYFYEDWDEKSEAGKLSDSEFFVLAEDCKGNKFH